MGVVAQGRDGVSVAEPSLSFEDLAFADQLRTDAVAEAVKARFGKVGGEAEPVEAMREQIGSGVAQPSEVRSEDPVAGNPGGPDALSP